MNELENLRAELTAAETVIVEATTTRAAAQLQLDDAESAFRAAHTTASRLRQQIAKLERGPHDLALFEQRLAQLRNALRSAPVTSPTAKAAHLALTRLEASQEPVSDHLNTIAHLLKDVQNHYILDRQVWDAQTPGIIGREPHRTN